MDGIRVIAVYGEILINVYNTMEAHFKLAIYHPQPTGIIEQHTMIHIMEVRTGYMCIDAVIVTAKHVMEVVNQIGTAILARVIITFGKEMM